jgi:hypothetical protein
MDAGTGPTSGLEEVGLGSSGSPPVDGAVADRRLKHISAAPTSPGPCAPATFRPPASDRETQSRTLTAEEQRAVREENAKDDERFWDTMRNLNSASAEQHKDLIAAAEAKLKGHESAAADASEKLETGSGRRRPSICRGAPTFDIQAYGTPRKADDGRRVIPGLDPGLGLAKLP